MQTRGTEIRSQREQCGLGLRAFAARIGISPGWLSKIETDQGNPSPDVVKRIALVLHEERHTRAAIATITEMKPQGT